MESYNRRIGHSMVDTLRLNQEINTKQWWTRDSCVGSSHLTSRDVRAVKQEMEPASASQPSLPSWLLLNGEETSMTGNECHEHQDKAGRITSFHSTSMKTRAFATGRDTKK